MHPRCCRHRGGSAGWQQGSDRGTGDRQRCCKSKWKNLAPREPRRTGGCIFSWRGNAEGLVLICLHYPFHSSFKSTKYTFPLRCPPRRSRQKKSNFPQFAPNSSPLPSAPSSPSPISEPLNLSQLFPPEAGKAPAPGAELGQRPQRSHPWIRYQQHLLMPAGSRGDPLLPTSLVQDEHPTDRVQPESPNTPLPTAAKFLIATLKLFQMFRGGVVFVFLV